MKKTYYSAIVHAEKPFISWNSVGSFTTAEFKASEYADDPLVVSEDRIPNPINVFGVCPLKIVSGVLEDRTPGEMAVFEAEYNIEISLKSERLKIKTINDSFFVFDEKSFPMDEVSRLFYIAISQFGDDQKIKTIDNALYLLSGEKILPFMTAFFTKLLSLSKHTI